MEQVVVEGGRDFQLTRTCLMLSGNVTLLRDENENENENGANCP